MMELKGRKLSRWTAENIWRKLDEVRIAYPHFLISSRNYSYEHPLALTLGENLSALYCDINGSDYIKS